MIRTHFLKQESNYNLNLFKLQPKMRSAISYRSISNKVCTLTPCEHKHNILPIKEEDYKYLNNYIQQRRQVVFWSNILQTTNHKTIITNIWQQTCMTIINTPSYNAHLGVQPRQLSDVSYQLLSADNYIMG